MQRGVTLAETGDVAGAIAAHEAALARDPSLAQAHANLITLYGRAANWAKAEEHYRAVVALGGDLADAHYDYGVLLGLQEKWDRRRGVPQGARAQSRSTRRRTTISGRFSSASASSTPRPTNTGWRVESQPTFRLARFNLGRMLLALGTPRRGDRRADEADASRSDGETPRYSVRARRRRTCAPGTRTRA